ncbi:MAG: SAM-dependent chlorinase/fluorinase [Gammaproteobacteria bacterium]|nr:SAM-dependent chlorinase/fluorinase [Gammaproteobacteria bacterium]
MRLAYAAAALLLSVHGAAGPLVLQTDFGLEDHAVAAMRGVARRVAPGLVVDDLTHEIPAFDIWQAAYRLHAVVNYWPSDTVFVSVVDPGVGSDRESVVARLANGQLVVTPNNGTLTLLHDGVGVVAVRRIDESKHRLPGSERSHTFHGRDLYAHVGALLASGKLRFEEAGEATQAVRLDYQRPTIEANRLVGNIPVLDVHFGNIWTNLPADWKALTLGVRYRVTITGPDGARRFADDVPFARTFADVGMGEAVLYVNSVGKIAVALNQASFAERFDIASGPGWRVLVEALPALE